MAPKFRTDIDPVTSRQASAGGMVRVLYAVLLVGLGLVLGWLVVKPVIYTQSAGQVLAPRFTVSVPFSARVTDVLVAPGTRVKAGDVVARIRAPEIDALRATLVSSLGAQANAVADRRVQKAVVEATLPAARRRAAIAADNVRRLGDKGCIATSVFCAEVFREDALASVMLAETEAKLKVGSSELDALISAQKRTQAIYDEVLRAYNGGNQTSPITGIVSTQVVHAGQSVNPGDTIIDILDDRQKYVEWIIDSDSFSQPQMGDPVYILDGQRVMRGKVSGLLSVSDVAFTSKSMFRPPESGQVAYVKLDVGETYPPVLEQVEVRYNYWRMMDAAVAFYVLAMERLGLWVR